MLKFQLSSFDTPPALVEAACPAPKTGELKLRVLASAVNFADLLLLDGTYQDTPPPPFVPGLEFAGEVTECGAETDAGWLGKRVMVFAGQGGFATETCVPANRCIALPDGVCAEEASGVQVAWGTADLGLRLRAGLQPGERLLVTGAGGGAGLAAVILGKRIGAEVIAAARGTDKCAAARAAGADHVIDTRTTDLREHAKSLGGAHVIYDTVGGEISVAAFRAALPEARFLLIGFASGNVPEIALNHVLVKNIAVIGVNWSGAWHYAQDRQLGSGRELLRLADAGKISANIQHRYPLSRVAEALELLKNRASTGKIVVIPDALFQANHFRAD